MTHIAEKEVPYPWLYFAEVLSTSDYEHVNHPTNYCFRIDNRFAVTLQLSNGSISHGQLNKWDYKFHYEPVSNFSNLITLETALERIWEQVIARQLIDEIEQLMALHFREHIEKKFECTLKHALEKLFENTFDHLFEVHPIGPFHSCAFYKPFSVEYSEPCYFFRLHDSTYEIVVGAHNGDVKYRRNEELMSNGSSHL